MFSFVLSCCPSLGRLCFCRVVHCPACVSCLFAALPMLVVRAVSPTDMQRPEVEILSALPCCCCCCSGCQSIIPARSARGMKYVIATPSAFFVWLWWCCVSRVPLRPQTADSMTRIVLFLVAAVSCHCNFQEFPLGGCCYLSTFSIGVWCVELFPTRPEGNPTAHQHRPGLQIGALNSLVIISILFQWNLNVLDLGAYGVRGGDWLVLAALRRSGGPAGFSTGTSCFCVCPRLVVCLPTAICFAAVRAPHDLRRHDDSGSLW